MIDTQLQARQWLIDIEACTGRFKSNVLEMLGSEFFMSDIINELYPHLLSYNGKVWIENLCEVYLSKETITRSDIVIVMSYINLCGAELRLAIDSWEIYLPESIGSFFKHSQLPLF